MVGREDAEQAWVGVLEHRVAVSAGGEPLVLEAGDSVRYDHTGIERQQLDLRRATSWQRGLLVFDRVPLAQVIEELNRYRQGRILLTNAQLGQRQVSGVFRLDSLDDALATLTAELHVQRTDLPLLSLIY